MVEQEPGSIMVSGAPIEVDVDESGRARAGSVSNRNRQGAAGGLALGRTSTVESVRSSNSGGSGGSNPTEGPLSSILSNTKAFFRKRGSVSAADSHPASASAVEQLPPQTEGSSGTRSSAMEHSTSSTRSPKPGNISLPKPVIQTANGMPFDVGGASSNTALQNTGTTNSSAPRRVVSPSALGRGSSDESRMSVLSSGTTATDASTAPSSVSSPTAASGFPASTASLGQGQHPNVQARFKALPRLASYTVPTNSSSHAAEGSNSNTITSAGYDSSATMSGTDTEQEPSDTEDDDEEGDEEDEDDDEHTEEDVRGGAAAMRTSLRRPALPTLASRSGGLNRLSSPVGAPARMTPFAMSPNSNPFQFQGWTTFASSTPTPGPLRTARPGPNDSAPNGSYFDARPISSSSIRAYGTPAQTPRPLSGDVTGTATPGGRFRSPM